MAVVLGLVVASLGVGFFTHTSTSQLAVAQRNADLAASRGSARGNVAADSTTTTTAAPTTTTTAPPAPTTTPPTTAAPKPAAVPASSNSQSGGASYYSQPWAAKGCAHRTLPKGTVVTVTNVSNGRSTTCVINDRGPFVGGRIIDMDTTKFTQIASTSQGVAQVRLTW